MSHDPFGALQEFRISPSKTSRFYALSALEAAGLGKMAFEVSAVTGEGIDRLLEAISEILDIGSIEMDLLVPYGEGWVIPFIHENGELLSSEYTDEGIKIRVNIDRAKAGRLREFMK